MGRIKASIKHSISKKSFLIVSLLIFFFPLGLFLMWKYSNWKFRTRWVITVIFAGLIFLSLSGNGKALPDKELTQQPDPIASATAQEQSVSDTQQVQSTPSTTQPAKLNPQQVKVTRVIDGDTIEIEGGQRVRYIGIDTPETVDPRKSIQCFGKEASDQNKRLVDGKEVRLEKDVSETDRYGRLLRYVSVEDIFVNDYLVREGYAHASSYPPDVKYQDQFTQAQNEARSNSKGLWSSACATPTTQFPQNTTVTPDPKGSQTTLPNCTIKGNISSSGEKIYHMPGQRFYDKTVIDNSKGERWFCSESEAQSAGWRKSKV